MEEQAFSNLKFSNVAFKSAVARDTGSPFANLKGPDSSLPHVALLNAPLQLPSAIYLPPRLVSRSVEMNGSVYNETDKHSHSLPVDENTLNGPPLTTWNDFKHAKLRQFPGRGTQIEWLEYLGHGEEGIVYKASIGNGKPIAIKVVRVSMLAVAI